jgi:hypothetical protein
MDVLTQCADGQVYEITPGLGRHAEITLDVLGQVTGWREALACPGGEEMVTHFLTYIYRTNLAS